MPVGRAALGAVADVYAARTRDDDVTTVTAGRHPLLGLGGLSATRRCRDEKGDASPDAPTGHKDPRRNGVEVRQPNADKFRHADQDARCEAPDERPTPSRARQRFIVAVSWNGTHAAELIGSIERLVHPQRPPTRSVWQ